MNLNRRDFLKTGAFALGSSYFANLNKIMASDRFIYENNYQNFSPLINIEKFNATKNITGDMFDEAHEIFWNKEGFIKKKGGLATANEHYDVIIVGGGIAALSSAFYLIAENKKVLILEGHQRLGGNSKAEVYQKTLMSLGTAYVTVPEEGDPLEKFYKDLGLNNYFRKTAYEDEPVAVKGRIKNGFWSGATDPKNADQFLKAQKILLDVYENSYPDLPLIPGMDIDRDLLNKYDSTKFQDWVTKEIPGIHPHINEFFHQYCWSSFGCSYEEISAAQALNFITSDMQGIQVLPGGNALIAKAILDKIKNGNLTIKTNTFVCDIKDDQKGVYVCFHHNNTVLKAVTGTKTIVTAPKMVSKHIVSDLSKSQHEAMNDIRYHAYLVANVILNKNIPAKYYDIYSLIESVPTHEYEDSKSRVFSDIIYSHWANENEANKSALTLYLPLPYDMAQQFLFSPMLYDKYSERIKNALTPFHSDLGITQNDIDGIRLTRYGHALPVATTGGISNGLFEKAHQPIDDKIFFANQDNWGNPCFETSFATGYVAAFQAMNKEFDI